MNVVEITGSELSELLRHLRSELRESDTAIHTLRVALDVNGAMVMVKFNEGMWSVPFGRRDGQRADPVGFERRADPVGFARWLRAERSVIGEDVDLDALYAQYMRG